MLSAICWHLIRGVDGFAWVQVSSTGTPQVCGGRAWCVWPADGGMVRMGFSSAHSAMSLSKQVVVPLSVEAQKQVPAEVDTPQPELDGSYCTSMADVTWDASWLLLAEDVPRSAPGAPFSWPRVLVYDQVTSLHSQMKQPTTSSSAL